MNNRDLKRLLRRIVLGVSATPLLWLPACGRTELPLEFPQPDASVIPSRDAGGRSDAGADAGTDGGWTLIKTSCAGFGPASTSIGPFSSARWSLRYQPTAADRGALARSAGPRQRGRRLHPRDVRGDGGALPIASRNRSTGARGDGFRRGRRARPQRVVMGDGRRAGSPLAARESPMPSGRTRRCARDAHGRSARRPRSDAATGPGPAR